MFNSFKMQNIYNIERFKLAGYIAWTGLILMYSRGIPKINYVSKMCAKQCQPSVCIFRLVNNPKASDSVLYNYINQCYQERHECIIMS